MIPLGATQLLWGYVIGMVATATMVCSAFLYIRRNGGATTIWVSALLAALSILMAEMSAVVVVEVAHGHGLNHSSFFLFHYGIIPVVVVLVWFIIRIVRSKL